MSSPLAIDHNIYLQFFFYTKTCPNPYHLSLKQNAPTHLSIVQLESNGSFHCNKQNFGKSTHLEAELTPLEAGFTKLTVLNWNLLTPLRNAFLEQLIDRRGYAAYGGLPFTIWTQYDIP